MLSKIEKRLPPGWRWLLPDRPVDKLYSFFFNRGCKNERVRRFHILSGNSQVLARLETEEELLEEFERQVNAHIFQTCRDRCFVHAGVVSWKGKTIVIPGGSYTGKTTLVKEFLKQGATYYSDEVAVFDGRGHVLAFPKPLGIRNGTSDKQFPLPPTSLPCKIGLRPIPVGLILITQYGASSSWRPRTTSSGKGALELLANAMSARTNPLGALVCLGRIATGAKVLCGRRGEAHDLVQRVLAGEGLDRNEREGKVVTSRR